MNEFIEPSPQNHKHPGKSNRIFYGVLMAMVAVVAGYNGYKHYNPTYCISQQRYLPDEEFIQIAVRAAIKSPPDRQPDIDSSEASIRNFYRDHPGCCHVSRKPPGRDWDDIWPVIVGMYFKTKEPNSRRNDPDKYVTITGIDECGAVMEQSGGA